MIEQTLSIIKPDAVAQNRVGSVLQRIEEAGLRIRALKRVRMTREEAGRFYAVHRDRPFYESLTAFMSEGPIVAMVLEGDGAIAHLRHIMGATDPLKAEPGTIRKDFATSVERNVIHGSDSKESATFEIGYFFSALEIL